MGLLKADVTIEGVRPLFFHVFGPDSLPLVRQEKTGVAGNDPEEWRKTYTATSDGQLYLRSDYIVSCLISASKYTRKGARGNYSKDVASTLQVLSDKLLLDRWIPDEVATDSEQPVYLDVRSVKNPVTKGRNIRYRIACSSGWKTSFSVIFEASIIPRGIFESVLLDAGTLSGLGDARSIGMGRFQTISCTFSDF